MQAQQANKRQIKTNQSTIDSEIGDNKEPESMLRGKDTITFEDRWPTLQPTVLKLLGQESVSKTEWHDLFYGVHLICLWDEKDRTRIYECLQEDITEYIKQAKTNILAQREEQALINAYIIEWRKFFTQSNYLPLPFRQLELSKAQSASCLQNANSSNSTAISASGASSSAASGGTAAANASSGSSSSSSQKNSTQGEALVRELMLNLWNVGIFRDITARLQESAMKLVEAERIGDAFDSLFDSQLVIGVRDSYVNLCSNQQDKLLIYRENFEAAYLKTTADFYRLKAQEQLQANGVQSFMRYADTKLREEEARAQRYLEPSSFDALKAACVSVLVQDTLPTLLAECTPLIKAADIERLQLMFRLLDRVALGVDPMLNDLENHIVCDGLQEMVSAAAEITQDSEKYVERLLELFRRYSILVKDAFNNDPRFLTARDKAFKTVVNDVTVFKLELPTTTTTRTSKSTTPESKCPELLANYCDMLLRKTALSKRLTNEQIESRLKDVLLVLKYVNNKDVFMLYHKAHLTRR